MENTRRKFLKKVAYTAPVVVGLGMLSAPVNADAKTSKVKCNNGWGNGDQCAPGKSLPSNNAENNNGGLNSEFD